MDIYCNFSITHTGRAMSKKKMRKLEKVQRRVEKEKNQMEIETIKPSVKKTETNFDGMEIS